MTKYAIVEQYDLPPWVDTAIKQTFEDDDNDWRHHRFKKDLNFKLFNKGKQVKKLDDEASIVGYNPFEEGTMFAFPNVDLTTIPEDEDDATAPVGVLSINSSLYGAHPSATPKFLLKSIKREDDEIVLKTQDLSNHAEDTAAFNPVRYYDGISKPWRGIKFDEIRIRENSDEEQEYLDVIRWSLTEDSVDTLTTSIDNRVAVKEIMRSDAYKDHLKVLEALKEFEAMKEVANKPIGEESGEV